MISTISTHLNILTFPNSVVAKGVFRPHPIALQSMNKSTSNEEGRSQILLSLFILNSTIKIEYL